MFGRFLCALCIILCGWLDQSHCFSLVKAQLYSSGWRIQVSTLSLDSPPSSVVFDCSVLLNVVNGSICTWLGPNSVLMELASQTTLKPGDSITTSRFVSGFSSVIVTAAAASFSSDLFSVEVNGPSTVGSCGILRLFAFEMSGIGSKSLVWNWKTTTKTVTSGTALNIIAATNTSALELDTSLLPEGNIAFVVQVTSTQFGLTTTSPEFIVNKLVSPSMIVQMETRVNFLSSIISPLRLSGNIQLPSCFLPSANATSAQWDWGSAVGYESKVSNIVDQTQFTLGLYVPPNSMVVKERYFFQLRTGLDLNFLDTKVFVEIQETPPILKIFGGPYQYTQSDKDFVLDASASYDVDFPTYPLNFSWSCQNLNNATAGCTKSLDGQIFANFTALNASILIVPGGFSAAGSVLQFTVVVQGTYIPLLGQARLLKTRVSSSSVVKAVFVNNSTLGLVGIREPIATNNLVVAHKRALVQAFWMAGTRGDSVVAWSWSLVGNSNPPGVFLPQNTTIGSVNSEYLSISPNILLPGATYQFKVSATTRLGYSGQCIVSVKVANIPRMGNCFALPTSGVMLSTVFNLACYGWSAEPEDIPLQYQWYFVDSNFSSTQEMLIPASAPTMWISRARLPYGTSNSLLLQVEIQTQTGALSRQRLAVMVQPVNITQPNSGSLDADLLAKIQLAQYERDGIGLVNTVAAISQFLQTTGTIGRTVPFLIDILQNATSAFSALPTRVHATPIARAVTLLAGVSAVSKRYQSINETLNDITLVSSLISWLSTTSSNTEFDITTGLYCFSAAESLLNSLVALNNEQSASMSSIAFLRSRIQDAVSLIQAASVVVSRDLIPGDPAFSRQGLVQISTIAIFAEALAQKTFYFNANTSDAVSITVPSDWVTGSTTGALLRVRTSVYDVQVDALGSLIPSTPLRGTVGLEVFSQSGDLIPPLMALQTPFLLNFTISQTESVVGTCLSFLNSSENLWSRLGCMVLAFNSTMTVCTCHRFFQFASVHALNPTSPLFQVNPIGMISIQEDHKIQQTIGITFLSVIIIIFGSLILVFSIFDFVRFIRFVMRPFDFLCSSRLRIGNVSLTTKALWILAKRHAFTRMLLEPPYARIPRFVHVCIVGVFCLGVMAFSALWMRPDPSDGDVMWIGVCAGLLQWPFLPFLTLLFDKSCLRVMRRLLPKEILEWNEKIYKRKINADLYFEQFQLPVATTTPTSTTTAAVANSKLPVLTKVFKKIQYYAMLSAAAQLQKNPLTQSKKQEADPTPVAIEIISPASPSPPRSAPMLLAAPPLVGTTAFRGKLGTLFTEIPQKDSNNDASDSIQINLIQLAVAAVRLKRVIRNWKARKANKFSPYDDRWQDEWPLLGVLVYLSAFAVVFALAVLYFFLIIRYGVRPLDRNQAGKWLSSFFAALFFVGLVLEPIRAAIEAHFRGDKELILWLKTPFTVTYAAATIKRSSSKVAPVTEVELVSEEDRHKVFELEDFQNEESKPESPQLHNFSLYTRPLVSISHLTPHRQAFHGSTYHITKEMTPQTLKNIAASQIFEKFGFRVDG